MQEALNNQLWYLSLFLGSVVLNILFVLVIWGLHRQRLYSQRRLVFALKDHSQNRKDDGRDTIFGEVSVDEHGNWLSIGIDGYTERDAIDGEGKVVFLEYYASELRLYYTDDINDTHQPVKLVLEGAHISNRIQTEQED